MAGRGETYFGGKSKKNLSILCRTGEVDDSLTTLWLLNVLSWAWSFFSLFVGLLFVNAN